MVNVSAQLRCWFPLLCLASETLNVFRASSHYSHALRQRLVTIQSTFWHTCACSKTLLQNVTYMWQDTLTLSKHILVCIGQETLMFSKRLLDLLPMHFCLILCCSHVGFFYALGNSVETKLFYFTLRNWYPVIIT